MTKLQKLFKGATDLEILMQRHRGDARDDSYVVLPLHVPFDNWSGVGRWLKSWPKKCYNKLLIKACSWSKGGCPVSFSARWSCQQVKVVATMAVEARNGLACGQGGQMRRFLAFGWDKQGQWAFNQRVSSLNRRCWAWDRAAIAGWSEVMASWGDGRSCQWWKCNKVFGREVEPWWGMREGREKRGKRKKKRDEIKFSGENLEFITSQNFS